MNTVKVSKLSTGQEFYLPGHAIDPGTGKEAIFRIIGRASELAPLNGKKQYAVKCVHIPQPGEQNTQESKFFSTLYEVVPTSRGKRSIDAIDMRDQPDDIETVEQVAARNGINLGEED